MALKMGGIVFMFLPNVKQCIRTEGGGKIRFPVGGSSASCADALLLD